MTLPKATVEKPRIWLVWSLLKNGQVELNAVDLYYAAAKYHKGVLDNDHGRVRAWIEESRANHLFAGNIMFSGLTPTDPAELERAMRPIDDEEL